MGLLAKNKYNSSQEKFYMHDYISNLTHLLRLTPYQSDVLKSNINNYNLGHIVKRGGVIYVPYVSRGIYAWIIKKICGVRADLIGQNKILIRNKRNIRFYKNGYYCVKIGRYIYYADSMGHAISRNEFLQEIKN